MQLVLPRHRKSDHRVSINHARSERRLLGQTTASRAVFDQARNAANEAVAADFVVRFVSGDWLPNFHRGNV